ncbi:hypothetical protein AB0K60_14190 [Thermopolyspora sp. NPDC052614]|uniref:hypothetical protein n=1 Tax=Thermopolyspora sp. NPDC052614 TaxID=3155682 RepID=UPI00343B0585
MSRQSEAWNAWPADAPSHDPYWATPYRYASDPRTAQAVLNELLDGHASGAFGPHHPGVHLGDQPGDHLGHHLGHQEASPVRRPAAVRSPISPRRARRAGTRRKTRPRDRLLAARWAWAVTRIAMGLIFLWAFADRLAGFGRPVSASRSWLNGGSPTHGYLTTAEGPFAAHFHAMAEQPWTDWLFMSGMAGVGLALVLGIGMRVAAVSGVTLMGLIYLAGLPVESNPFLDQHVIYALVIIALAVSHAGDTLGLGGWWSRTRLVRAVPALR